MERQDWIGGMETFRIFCAAKNEPTPQGGSTPKGSMSISAELKAQGNTCFWKGAHQNYQFKLAAIYSESFCSSLFYMYYGLSDYFSGQKTAGFAQFTLQFSDGNFPQSSSVRYSL